MNQSSTGKNSCFREQELRILATGTNSWSLGSVSLQVNKDASYKARRGHAKDQEQGWLKWLNPSLRNPLPSSWLVEIALALQDFGHTISCRLLGRGVIVKMEGNNARLPMATWPLFVKQFFNEKLVTDVLKIGVVVGAKEWRQRIEFWIEVGKNEEIGKAISLLMGSGAGSTEMRERGVVLSNTAKRAIQVGGSYHTNMLEVIRELKPVKLERIATK